MRRGDDLPHGAARAPLHEGLLEMSRKRTRHDRGGGRRRARCVGIFTDGDLRRALDRGLDIHESTHGRRHDARTARSIGPNELAAEAVQMMEKHKVNGLLCSTSRGALVGALNVHDLLRAGVM